MMRSVCPAGTTQGLLYDTAGPSANDTDEHMIDSPGVPASPSEVLFGGLANLPGDPGSLVPSTTGFTSKPVHATDDDWEKHRQEIKHLYQEQGKKLHDVKTILERKYSFKATSVNI